MRSLSEIQSTNPKLYIVYILFCDLSLSLAKRPNLALCCVIIATGSETRPQAHLGI
jgi:hypothetical protein